MVTENEVADWRYRWSERELSKSENSIGIADINYGGVELIRMFV